MTINSIALACLLAGTVISDSHSWAGRASDLRTMLVEKRFDEVEKGLVDLQEAFERSEVSEAAPWASLHVFITNDGPTEQALSEWVVKKPNSYAALAARGTYYESSGWNQRGTRLAGETSPGQIIGMQALHAAAETDCVKALSIRPALVACHVTLINIAKAKGDSAAERTRYTAARMAVPKSAFIAIARLESLTPRWGGSHEEMNAFLEQIDKTLLATNPDVKALLGYVIADEAAMKAINGDYEGAIELYSQAIARGGESAIYYSGRASNAFRLQRNAAARKDFDRAIELSPFGWPYSEAKLPLALASRARIQSLTGQLAAAQVDLRDALALNPLESYARELLPILFPLGVPGTAGR